MTKMPDAAITNQRQFFFSSREKKLILFYLMLSLLPSFIYFAGAFDIEYSAKETLSSGALTSIAVGDVSSIHEADGNSIAGSCQVMSVTNLSVCGFNYRIGDDVSTGVDLRAYDSVTFSISVTGPRAENSVRFQFRNFNEAYSDNSVNDSLKYMGVTVDGFEETVTYTIPLNEFGVESWWLYNNEIGMKHSGLDFSNIVDFIVVHNGLHAEGEYKTEIKDIYLSGQIISMEVAILISFLILSITLSTALFRYYKKLQIVSQKAEAANDAKSRFLSNMSHEIRTPLNGILGTLQLVQHKQVDTESDKLVNQSLYSAKSLLVIINDILDFSKIEANQLALENSPFSFLKLVNGIIRDMRTDPKSDGLTITSDVDKEFIDGWLGDAVRVKQILLNLVSNAVKFTHQGKVSIDIKSELDNDKPNLCFTVTDTGIGMSEEFQDFIFDRFSQADTSISRKYGGTGLGMAITINLIHLMDGSLDIKSTENIGTSIFVKLPLDKAEIPQSSIAVEENSKIPDLSNFKILIAEDNEINQAIIEAMIAPTNATMEFVENGELAVAACKEYNYDLILLDIQMPKMDGEEAFTCIREFNEKLPIIALTANVMQEDIERYKALGFNAHIGKPIIKEHLYKTLDENLNS